jgi:predicted secreted hydrolase
MASLGEVTVTLAFDDAVAALTAIRDEAASQRPDSLVHVYKLACEALKKIQLGVPVPVKSKPPAPEFEHEWWRYELPDDVAPNAVR